MSRIRGAETGPERLLRHHLRQAGLRGWRKNIRILKDASSADVAFTRWRVAVFVDGAFWHGHPRFFTPGKSGPFWDSKIARNRARDSDTTRMFRKAGWQVVRLWDFDLEAKPRAAAARVVEVVRAQRLAAEAYPGRAMISNRRSKGNSVPGADNDR